MKDKIQSIVVLTVVCIIAAGGLAYVNDLTYVARHPAISPALVEALNALLPAHDNQLDKDVLKVGDNKYYVAKKAGQIVAYAFESSNSTGYNKTEPIDVLLVVDAKGAILATSIISQKETPGLGSKCTLPAFLDQFKGKDLKGTNFTVKKDGGDIDQVSGSTVTSRAVTLACKDGLARFHKEVLKEEVKPMAAAPKTAAAGPSVEVKAEQLKAALPAFDNDPLKETVDLNGSRYYIARKAGAVAGYGIYSAADGFGGKVEVIVGVTPECEVTGVVLLANGETQGYGKETLETPDFWTRFKGKNLSNAKWAVKADGGDFEQIKGSVSSATISSRGAVEAVKKALEGYVNNREALEAAKPAA